MTILQEINEKLLAFAKEVNNEILANNFTNRVINTHTVEITVLDVDVEIWNSNAPDSTSLYKVGDFQVGNNSFISPETCREILNKESVSEKKVKREKLLKELKALEDAE